MPWRCQWPSSSLASKSPDANADAEAITPQKRVNSMMAAAIDNPPTRNDRIECMSASSAIDSAPDRPVSAEKAQIAFKRRRETKRVIPPAPTAILVMTSDITAVKKESAAIHREMSDARA